MIAATGERFTSFEPYVPSVNDAGTVAFQAALPDGRTRVFAGSGGAPDEVAGATALAGVTSHPEINNAGAMSFYGDLLGGGQGVFLLHDGSLKTVADTQGPFASIGPLGPTMNEAGMVAFRADPAPNVSGVFAGDGGAVVTVADTNVDWSEFHGLPVVNRGGTVVFRADREDSVQGIYAFDDGSIRTVAETGDRFETLAPFPSISDDGTAAFAATLSAGGEGVFTQRGDDPPSRHDADGAFESYRGALITNAAQLLWMARPRGGNRGLFAGPDPEADRILALGDELLGSEITDVRSNPVSVNAVGQVAIAAVLADGRQLILRADPGD